MQTLWQDLRYGARMLMKKPGFTVIAVITLALGIGATTAIFSVVNAVLLRPLPYPEAERLVHVGQQYKSGVLGAGEPKFLFWHEQSQSFDGLAAYSSYGGANGNLSNGREAEYVRGMRVSADFFRVLGIYPVEGRAFTEAEDKPGGERVAILSYSLWQSQFGGDKSIIGKSVIFNDQPVTVVGIMPATFRFNSGTELFLPMKARPDANYDPNATVVGRLKSGVTLEQAKAELQLIADKYREAFPKQMQDGESLSAQPYQNLFTTNIAQLLWILLGAVGFLLLIACANVANLQLTRAATRQREIAVRFALGASNGRIIRQLLTEGILLAIIGGIAGVLLAVWGTELLLASLPQDYLPSVAQVSVDWRVLVFAFATSIATGVLFGMAPVWQTRKVDVNTTLKETSNRGGMGRGRLRNLLVVAEVALSLVLLIGAGLLIRTFTNLLGVAPGFDSRNVMTCQLTLNGERYDTTAKAAAFYKNALERINSLPGVEASAIINKLPLDWQFNMPVVFPSNPDQFQSVQFRMVTADYFRVMKIGVQQGRSFTDADNASAQPVAIVNEAFARRFFDNQNPLAQQLSVGRGTNDPVRQVVGIAADTKQQGLDSPVPPMVFVPVPQMPDKLLAIVRAFTSANFTIRTSVAPLSLREAVKHEIAQLDPTLSPSDFSSMEEVTARSIAPQRFNMVLVGLFAGLGLLLAAVGIYGVISYVVAQRTNEIGLRIALGAQAKDVIMLILRRGLTLAFSGVVLGLAAAFILTRLIKNFLYSVSTTDPVTFVFISLLLVGVALLACYLPARRAAKTDPMVALRYE